MKILNRRRSILRYPEFWIILILTLVLFPLRQAIAGAGIIEPSQIGTLAMLGPIFLASLGLTIFLIPGMALVVILGDDGDWWERLALAFVASMASVGIFSQIAAVRHTSIEFVLYAYLGLTLVLVAGAIARLFFFPIPVDDTPPSDRPPLWMWAILIAMVAMVIVFSWNARFDPDEIDAAGYVQNILHDPQIMVTEPKFNGDFAISVRYYLDTWLTDQALISRITGQDPLDQYPSIKLSLTLFTLAAFYTFARRITNRKNAAVLSTIAWALYLILSNHDSVAGYEVIVRPDLDKVVAGFIVVPVGIGIVKTLFDHHRRRDWVWLAAASLAAMLTHPIGVALLGLSVAGWGIAELITERSWQTLWRLALAGFILGMTLSPDVAVLVFAGKKESDTSGVVLAVTLTDTRDPALVGETLTTLALERLWVLDDGTYIMHPRLVFQPYFLPAFIALPILFWLMRRSRGARMLFGMLTVVPLVILFPPTANLIGRLTTPWIFYRLHWPIGLAALVTAGWGLAWLHDRLLTGTLPRIKLSVPGYGLAAAGLLVWLAFMGANAQSIQTNLGYQIDSLMNLRLNCLWTNDLLRPFQQLASEPSMVLGDPLVSTCLVSAAPYAGVMEFRMESTVRPFKHSGMEQEGWNRLSDFTYFETTQVVDQRLLQMIDKWKIKFVVVQTSRTLDSEMRHMPAFFQPLYTAEFETVYKVVSTNQADPTVQANSLLSQFKFSDAAAAFEKLQNSDSSDTRYLAQIGLGYAYQQMGRLDDALAVWGQAADSTKEGDPLALRAQVFDLRGQYDLAIPAYQQALARNPDNFNWPIALSSDLYRVHRVDEAATVLEAATAMTTVRDSAAYHSMLGSTWLGLNDYDRAVEQFKQAVAMTGTSDTYAALGGAYISARRVPEAENVIRQMANQDQWDEQVPLLRARVQALSGNWQSAADQVRQALKLNPSVAGGYDNFAMYATLQDGTRAALDQVRQIPGYRALRLGAALLTAARLETGMGQYEQADKDLVQALIWDGNNPDYWQAQGDVQLALGNTDKAFALYAKVIESQENPQPAYLALSNIADSQANIGLEQGYLTQSVYAFPLNPSGDLALGKFFLNQAQPDLAQRQYQAALDKQPDSAAVLSAIGDFYAQRGEFDQALKYYQDALTRSPVASQAYLGLGSVYLNQGKVTQATDAINQAVRVAPGVAAPRAALAVLDSQQGREDAAVQAWKQAIDQNPGFRFGYISLAGQYVNLDNTVEAQQVLQAFQQQFPMFVGAYVGLGQLAERRGDFAAAEKSYREALAKVSPAQSGAALLALGRLQSRQGARDQALQSFQAAIKQQPMLTSGYISAADVYSHDGDYARATGILKQGLALSPGAADLNAELGNLELAQGHIQQAQQIYDNYLKVFPGAYSIAIAKADMFAALGQPDVALNQVVQLQQQWAGVAAVLSARASLEMTNGQPQAAVDAARKLTGLVPGDAQSWILLGQTASNLGQFQDAEGAFRQGTTDEPGSASAWLALGEFLGTREQMDSAAAALLKSIQLDQTQTEPHIAMAEVKSRQGSQSDAISEYKQAVNLDHSQDDALLALGTLSSENGNFEEAGRYLDQALATSVTDARAYNARADLYLKQGQAELARRKLQQALNVIPGECQTYQNLGDYLASVGDFDTAKFYLNKALALPGCVSSAHISIGNINRVQAKPADAIAEYNKAIAAQPGSALPYAALARTYINQNRQQDAQAVYVEALSKAPASDLLTLNKGADLVSIGQVQQGMDLVLQATQLRPANASNLVALGRAYELVGQNANAEASLLEAVKVDASALSPHLELGQLYMRMARFDQALGEDNKAIGMAPGDARGYTQLGDYYASRAQYDSAISAYQKGTGIDQSQSESLLGLGQLYITLGRWTDAERTLQQALAVRNSNTSSSSLSTLEQDATAPTAARALAALGDLYLSEAQLQKAEAAFKQAVQVAPASTLGYLRLSQLYASQNRPADAMAQIKRALEVAPTSASAYVALGTYQQAQADSRGAEQSFLQAIAVAPIDPSGYVHLGQLYQVQGRQQDALKQYLAATKAASGSPRALIALGDWQTLYAMWDDAEKSYTQAVNLAPGDPSGYLSLGAFYEARGKNNEALAQLQSAVKVAPASATALIALGDWHQSQLKWADAEQAYTQAIAVSPANPAAYAALSKARVKRGKLDDAEAQLKTARARVPGSVDAMLALATYYGERGQWVKAQEQIQAAASLQPGSVDAQIARAEILESQALFPDAEQGFGTAIKLAPGLAKPYVALGDFQSTRGNGDAAAAEYHRALAMEPTNESAFLGLVKVKLDVNCRQMSLKVSCEQDALKQAEEWAKVAPAGQVSALTTLGELRRINGDFTGSEQAYRAGIDRLPGVMDPYVGLSQTQTAEAKFGDALQLLDRATAIAPGYVPTYLSRALAQYAMGQPDAAVASLHQASDADLSSARPLVALARDAQADDQPAQAIQFYQQAIVASPTDPVAYDGLTALYGTTNDLGSALSTAQKAQQTLPALLSPRMQLAQVHSAQEDMVAARDTLQQAMPLFPNAQAEILTEIGQLYVKFDYTPSARQTYDALALDTFHAAQARSPKLITPYLREGDLYRDGLKDSKKALELYQKAASIDGMIPEPFIGILSVYARERNGRPTATWGYADCPDLPSVRSCDSQGSVRVRTGWNLHNGLDDTLRKQYEAAAAANPTSVQSQVALAVLYQFYHLGDQAIAAWQRVLQLDPANQDAYLALSEDYGVREKDRVSSASALAQAMALGLNDQSTFTQLAQLNNDRITSIPDGATYGTQITISGSANGANTGSVYPFSYYKIEVGVGTDPKEWTTVVKSSTPVTNGVLGVWDTAVWPNGTYTMRLVVVDTSGNFRPYDVRTIHLQHHSNGG